MIFFAPPDAIPAQQRLQREYSELTPQSAMVIAASGDASGAEPIEIESESDAAVQIEITLPVAEWTKSLEREFLSLAVASATEKADAVDEKRLASLQTTRRRLANPRPMEEIIAEYHARQTTRELAEALQKYVRFRNSKADPWASAKTNIQRSHVSKGD